MLTCCVIVSPLRIVMLVHVTWGGSHAQTFLPFDSVTVGLMYGPTNLAKVIFGPKLVRFAFNKID